MSYNNVETIRGNVLRLVEEKLGLDPGKHTIQYATQLNSDGYCETCYYEGDSFVILVDGDEVYHSGFASASNPFGDLQEWLEDYDA